MLLLPSRHAGAAPLKIAIVEFDAMNQLAKSNGWGRYVAESLTTAAVNGGAFEVVERHQMQKIMNEQMVGERDKGFASNAQSVANMAGADYVLSGSVMQKDSQLDISARIMDVATGAILTAQKVNSSTNLKTLSRSIEGLMRDLEKGVYGSSSGAQSAPAQGPAGVAAPPLQAALKLAAADGLTIEVQENDVLTSSDGYYLQLGAGRKLYVYAGQVDAGGTLYALFPNQAFSPEANPLSPGSSVRVPGQENFHLDENTGIETVYVLASPGPVQEIERVFQRLDTADPFAMEDLVRQFQDAVEKGPAEYKKVIRFRHE